MRWSMHSKTLTNSMT